jgi:predicted amidohydrolase
VVFLLLALSGCEAPGWSYPTGYDAFTAELGYDTNGGTRFLAAAAVSFQSDKTDKAANLASMAAMAARIMTDHPDTDVIVFHEMCTGWVWEPESPAAYFASLAEPIPGPSTAYVADLAAAHNVTIVFGLAEDDNGTRYNSQAMLKPDGTLVSYRKRGLNDGDKAGGCTPGAGAVISDIKGIPVTFAICSDYQDEAVIKDLSTNNAPIVLASLVTATRLNGSVDFFARALGKWVVYANGGGAQWGATFPGNIFIADPTGTIHDPMEGAGSYSWTLIGLKP